MEKIIQPISPPGDIKPEGSPTLSASPLPSVPSQPENTFNQNGALNPLQPNAQNSYATTLPSVESGESDTEHGYLISQIHSLLTLAIISLLLNGFILFTMFNYKFSASETGIRYFGIGWGLIGLLVTIYMFLAKEGIGLRKALKVYFGFMLFATVAVALSRNITVLILALYSGLIYYVIKKLRPKILM